MKETENITLWLIALGIAVIMGYAIYKTVEANQLRAELDVERKKRKQIEANNLNLLDEFLKKTKSIPENLKLQLDELKNNYSSIDKDVEVELTKITKLLDEGNEAIVVEKLTKVIENILEKKLEQEAKIAKRRNLAQMVQEAIERNLICKRVGDFIHLLRGPRNEEAHELNVSFKKEEVEIYFAAAILVLFELMGVKKSA